MHGDASHSTSGGALLDRGWRYDLETWFFDTFLVRGGLRELRRAVLDTGGVQAGSAVLDVGCGTGTLAISAASRAGREGRLAGIDPAPRQIARAKAKARRARVAVDFRTASIDALPFDDGSFDVVTSTLMMHHLPDDLKRRGLAEIARVLRPGGRLVIADFVLAESPDAQRAMHRGHRFEAVAPQSDLLRDAGFVEGESTGVRFRRAFHGFSGTTVIVATRRD